MPTTSMLSLLHAARNTRRPIRPKPLIPILIVAIIILIYLLIKNCVIFLLHKKYILYVFYANKKLNFFTNRGRIRFARTPRTSPLQAHNTAEAYCAASLARLAIAEANTKSLSSRVVGMQDIVLGPSPPLTTVVDVYNFSPISITGVHVVRVDDRRDVVLARDFVDQVVDDDRGLRVEARVGLVAEQVTRDSSRWRGRWPRV